MCLYLMISCPFVKKIASAPRGVIQNNEWENTVTNFMFIDSLPPLRTGRRTKYISDDLGFEYTQKQHVIYLDRVKLIYLFGRNFIWWWASHCWWRISYLELLWYFVVCTHKAVESESIFHCLSLLHMLCLDLITFVFKSVRRDGTICQMTTSTIYKQHKRIALKFDRHVGSNAADVPIKFPSDTTI